MSYTEDLAKQRIEILMEKAEEIFDEDPERSHRYARLAWRIKLKTRVKFPKKWKRRFCRKCKIFLVPNKTCRIRLNNSKVTITCLNCGKIKRIPI
ncbi:MAG: RNase P subunit RPR2 [Candidatus Methanohalarchaeum thermophilum]|uniref:Ribonuclease P protein component 4 n=1 Tax=Methanohalarchaeum thermophilum TaxID=1903181 RepID=A0A1Q6DU13_METT1|nr:MAG: RNase P subunit RPR2 [Candidatus Methanohalarchaeum thermophilum]